MAGRDDQVRRAKVAEQAELYEDMGTAMKKVTEMGAELSNEERTLLSVAYKTVLSAKLSSWQTISSIDKEQKIAKDYREKLEKEIRDVCNDVLGLLDKFLVPKASNAESKVFYLTMKGDYYMYLAEVAGTDKPSAVQESEKAYQAAWDIAKEQIFPAHPTRLNLALNFSFFCYEIINSREKAGRLAELAIDEASSVSWSTLDADSCTNSEQILQELRDHLPLYTSDAAVEETADAGRN